MKNILTQGELDQIIKICRRFNIINYKINPDGSIDVDGDVDMSEEILYDIPLNFNIVTGDFIVFSTNITSLKGCPREIGGDFNIGGNKLKDFIGGPDKVGGDVNCGVNSINSLAGSPKIVGGDFFCLNGNLTNLEGSPEIVGGEFNVDNNYITSLKGAPREVGNIKCYRNLIKSLEGCPITTSNINSFFTHNSFPKIVMDRLLGNVNNNKLNVFVKYQSQFDVWTGSDDFNEDGFNELMDEIEDGLL